MKKIILSLLILAGSTSLLKAQCYGTVQFDKAVNANGASSFTITTANPNEMILISYNGWPSPGNGPVTVDGNPATHIATAFDNNNSGVAEVYCYSAPLAGSHTINCTEPNYSSPYYLNMAAAFYVTGTCTPLSCSSLFYSTATVTCLTGGSVSTSITTTVPNSMIYCDAENNNGLGSSYPFSWTGATFLADLHIGNGIETSDAYATASAPATYTIKAANAAPTGNGCGGLALILVAIQPPLCSGSMTLTTTQVNPTCGNNNGSATVTVAGGSSPYTYSWSPSGGTNATASNLSAGTYTVTVKDATGCSQTTSVTLVNSPSVSVTVTNTGNVKCNGGATGSASASATGGTSPYTYTWAPSGGTNSNATGLSAGTYTVTVKDKNGCTATGTVTITQPTVLAVTTGGIVNVKCNGGTGSATANPSGGTPGYTYVWTPGGNTNATATGLSAGTYTVTVTDANGCTATATATITQPTALTVTTGSIVNVKCNGGTGSATANPSGGTSPYTYAWAPGGNTNAIATGLSAGTYTVTVTDANGCTATATATITQPTALTVTTSGIINVSCNGGSNGGASANPGGGTPAYTYAWSNGQTSSNATGLSAGTYTITVTDANGCTATATATITQPTALTVSTSGIINVSCNGGNNGGASANAGGGTPAYTYAWSNGETSSNATGLSAGTYTITVTDANGCTATATATITQPTALTQTTSFVQATCGNSNGSANITIGGGTPAYTYLWSNAQTSSSITGLSAGTYTITVTDANGCTITASVNVPNAGGETVTITGTTDVSCNGGNNGSILTNTTGGSAPYTYSWSNGQTGSNATGLSAGSYTVTVTDANGCTSIANATITEPPVLTATIGAPVNVSCNGGNNGSLDVTTGGGTTPYTYSWSNGQTSSNATGLTAGSYTVTVTDANGCSTTATATITEPPVLTVTTSGIVNVLCNGGNNGAADANAGGGTTPYTYSWSDGQTSSNATGLSAGTYTITLTDANGCSASATATITEPTALTQTTSFVQSTCGNANGSADITAGGGTPGYTYLWSDGQTSSSATGLLAGSYTVTVTDANGCTITASVNVTNASGETVTVTGTTDVSCNGGNNGDIITNTTGGVSPYTYSWSDGETTSNATGLTAGSYTVTVTDANGCTSTASATITEPTALTAVTGAPTNVSCNGNSDGSVDVTAGGGTPGYTYSWSNGETSSNATGLTAGGYTVTVTDANGCSITANATITEPPALTATMGAPTNVNCNGGTDGNVGVTAGGGTPGYTYLWTNGQTSSTATSLSAGGYTVTVTDSHGCTATANVTVTEPTAISLTITSVTSYCNQADGGATVTAGGGTPAYTYLWSNGQTSSSITNLTAGSYSVTVTDSHGCFDTISVNVPNSSGVTASMTSVSNVSCNGGSNGTLTVTAVGGVAPYTYAWSNGQTSSTATGLTAGSYTVTVTDSKGCSATASDNITQPPLLTVTAAGADTICIGQSATITATATGGTPGYKYSWSNGMTGSSISVSPATTTTYTVTVSDVNACTSGPATVTVTVRKPLSTVMGPSAATCPGGNVTISATASGGDGNYTYTWYPGGNTGPSITVSPATTTVYTVVVNDGCGTPNDSNTVQVIIDPLPVVNFSADTTAGCFPVCINFIDMSSISSGNMTLWDWNFGDGNSTSSNNPNPTNCYTNPGTYNVTLTVTSDSGCKATKTISNMITAYSHPVAAFDYSPNPATITDPTIHFMDKSTDNYGITGWTWTFGDFFDTASVLQNPTHTYIDTGTYCAQLTVTNKYGCKDSTTQCFVIAPEFTLYIPDAFSPNGDGINDVFQPKGDYVKDFKMYIFDRWGMLLYYTDDIYKGWNGTVRGGSTICQQDTYVYLIKVKNGKGDEQTYMGKVSIIQ